MTFEKDFPSLKDKVNNDVWVLVRDVQYSCLDKQKVKEVIDNFEMNHQRRLAGWDKCLDLLKKELGLR